MTALVVRPRRSLHWRRGRPLLALIAALGVVGATYALARPDVGMQSAPASTIGSLQQIDHSIQAWTTNLTTNDRDFYAATNLGLLYEARGRLTSDVGDYERARVALDRALAIVPADLPARVLHARVLLAVHDFEGALTAALAIERDEPNQLDAIATIGDASLELGDLRTADLRFQALAAGAPGAPVTARESRLAFLRGDAASAVRLAERAYEEARLTGQQGAALGWYAALAGSTQLSVGAPGMARTWFDRALAAWPTGVLPLAGMARAQVALGDRAMAIELLQRAAAVAPQPDVLAALGDLYRLDGAVEKADEQYDTVEAIARLAAVNQQVYNRQLVLFAASHGREVANALQLAERELGVRRDVYGYDAYAWALLANDRPVEAAEAMRLALAEGTQDSLLDYHAGMIALAIGDDPGAREYLTRALGRPGALDALATQRASAALAAIR